MTVIPPMSAGGPDKTAAIAGRVEGAPPGSQIVLFAKSNVGVWWIQPLAAEPFTAIDTAGNWKSTIHLGVEYAALLVASSYHPPSTTEASAALAVTELSPYSPHASGVPSGDARTHHHT